MKTIIKIFILSCLTLLFIGCVDVKSSSAEKNNAVERFFVSSTELTKNDVITINLPKVRPKNLAIIDPNGQMFIIHSTEEDILMMSEQEFSLIRVLEIPIRNTKGVTWVDGQKREKSIFEQPGKYKIYFADNLETEPENTFNFSADIIVH